MGVQNLTEKNKFEPNLNHNWISIHQGYVDNTMDTRLLERPAELERERPNNTGERSLTDEPVSAIRLMVEEDHGSASL